MVVECNLRTTDNHFELCKNSWRKMRRNVVNYLLHCSVMTRCTPWRLGAANHKGFCCKSCGRAQLQVAHVVLSFGMLVDDYAMQNHFSTPSLCII